MPVKLASSGRFPTHKMSALASRGFTFVTWRGFWQFMRHAVADMQLLQISSAQKHHAQAGRSCLKPRHAEDWMHVSVCPLCLSNPLPLQC